VVPGDEKDKINWKWQLYQW